MLIILYALFPAILIAGFFYLLDKHKEPVRLLFRAFAAGIAAVCILFVLHALIPEAAPFSSLFYLTLWQSFVEAAFREEVIKFVVFIAAFYRHPHFDERYDGMLYGALVGLGFAFIENISYFIRFGEEQGTQIYIARSVLSMPLHALVGSVMGYFVGRAKFASGKRQVPLLFLGAFFTPLLIHGLFNFFLLYYALSLQWVPIPLIAWLWTRVLRLKRLAQSIDVNL
jgi:protease PrsW